MNRNDKELIERFMASFAKLADLRANASLDPIGWELSEEESDPSGRRSWRPRACQTATSWLNELYADLPGFLPRLYEELILNYRWADVDLQLFTLFANPPGQGLRPLLSRISIDKNLWHPLLKKGYVPFGRGTDIDYDPVCFDLNSRRRNADHRVVKIDHEQVLCFNRVEVVAEVATSFRHLLLATVELAEKSVREQA